MYIDTSISLYIPIYLYDKGAADQTRLHDEGAGAVRQKIPTSQHFHLPKSPYLKALVYLKRPFRFETNGIPSSSWLEVRGFPVHVCERI